MEVNQERWDLALIRTQGSLWPFPESEQGCLLRKDEQQACFISSATRKDGAEPKIQEKNVMQNCSSVTDWEAESSIQTTQ